MATTDHPSSADLLLLLSNELDAERTDEVKAHLQQCGDCQRAIAEIESLYEGLARVDEHAAQYRIRSVMERRRHSFWKSIPRYQGWAAAVASSVIAALLLVTVMEYTPSARAEALLSHAANAEKAKGNRAHLLRVEAAGSGCSVSIRDAASVISASDSDQEVCGRFASHLQQVGWDWNDVLSANQFKRWRDGLHGKTDAIHTVGDATEVSTVTKDGPLHRVVLRVRSGDYHAMQARFQFAAHDGGNEPEFEVMERQDVPEERATSAAVLPTHGALPESPAAPETLVDPTDLAESDVRLALHRLGLDSSVLLAVKREPTIVEVIGVVSDRTHAESLAHALGGVEHVETNVSVEGEGRGPSTWQAFQGDAPPLAYDKVNVLFAEDPEARQKFINRVDMLTQRLVAEARTRDGLLALVTRLRLQKEADPLREALADTESKMSVDLGSLASTLEPISGPIKTEGTHLTAVEADDLFQLTHELLFRGKSESQRNEDDALAGTRRILSGK